MICGKKDEFFQPVKMLVPSSSVVAIARLEEDVVRPDKEEGITTGGRNENEKQSMSANQAKSHHLRPEASIDRYYNHNHKCNHNHNHNHDHYDHYDHYNH